MERAKERERDWMGGKGRKKIKVRMIIERESKPNEDTRKASDTNRETTTTKE